MKITSAIMSICFLIVIKRFTGDGNGHKSTLDHTKTLRDEMATAFKAINYDSENEGNKEDEDKNGEDEDSEENDEDEDDDEDDDDDEGRSNGDKDDMDEEYDDFVEYGYDAL